MKYLQLEKVEMIFDTKRGRFHALREIDLAVEQGEFVSIIGHSGCGKSTLLNLVAGLIMPSSGAMLCAGREIAGPGPERAMVFQHYSLYPWLNVVENIRFSRRLAVHTQHRTQADVEAAAGRADALLRLMGLAHVANHYPAQLSGGMQQRVAIARALMGRPSVLLMDEPFGALDAQTREVMHDLILHVQRLERSTIVFVTHDVEEALYLGQRVVLMAPRPGRIASIHAVPDSGVRTQDLKAAPQFIALKREITARIRETSGLATDFDLLARLNVESQA